MTKLEDPVNYVLLTSKFFFSITCTGDLIEAPAPPLGVSVTASSNERKIKSNFVGMGKMSYIQQDGDVLLVIGCSAVP